MEPLAILRDKTGQPFVVRPLAGDERDALEAMYRDFEPKRTAQGLPPESGEQLHRWMGQVLGTGDHLIVEIDGHIAGHGMLLPMDAGTAELANFLHQEIRDRGIGTALNRALLALAAQRGYARVWLCVEPSNRPAIRSYEKVGFRRLPGSLWAPEIEMDVEVSPGAASADPG